MYSTTNDLTKLLTYFLKPKFGQFLDSQTIREMMLPSFLSADLEDTSKGIDFAGIGFPFEIGYRDGIWINGKQGNAPGFSASIIIVQAQRFGLSVLLNNEAKNGISASHLAFQVADIIMPALKATFQNIYQIPLPPNPQNFVGTYVAESADSPYNYPLAKMITFDNTSKVLVLDNLLWISFLSQTGSIATFQTLQPTNQLCTPESSESGVQQEYIYITHIKGKPISMTCPGMFYGLSFIKQEKNPFTVHP